VPARPRQARLSGVGAGAAFGLVGAVVNAGAGLLLALVVSHGLGVAGSGVFFACVALFTILSNVLKLGADTGLVRFLARTGPGPVARRLVRAGLLPPLIASLVAAGVLLLVAHPIGRLLLPGAGTGSRTLHIVLVAAGLPLATVTLVLLGATRGLRTVMPFVGVEQIGKPALRVILVGLVIAVGAGGTAAYAAWSVPVLLGLLVAIAAVRTALRGTGTSTERPGGRAFWAFSAPRALASSFEIVSVWIGVLLLSAMRSSADAGIFTAAGRYVTVGGMAMLAIRLAVAPELSRLLGAGRIQDAERIHRQCTVWIVLSSWPIFLFGAVFAPAVLEVFGGGFRRGATALVILALANLLNLAVGNAQTVLLMVGRSSLNMINTGAALACQVGLGVALIPHLGLTGAAIGAGAGAIVDNGLSAIQVRRILGIHTVYRPYLLAIAASVGCFAGLALAGRAVLGTSIPAAVTAGVICCVAYAAVLGAFRRPLTLTGARTIFQQVTPLRQ